MFDFEDNTYSGVLSIMSCLLGMSYPLIVGCIEKIDSRFHSTKLTERFLREVSFKMFRWRKRSIPTHSEWLYPLTFDAGKGLKEA